MCDTVVIGNDLNISFSLLSNPVPLYISIYCILLVNFRNKKTIEIRHDISYNFAYTPSKDSKAACAPAQSDQSLRWPHTEESHNS